MLWAGLAGHIFLLGRCYFLFTLAVFITGQSILPQLHDDPSKQTDAERIAIFACRMIIYVFSMGQLFVNQVRCLIGDCRSGHIIRVLKFIPFPEYLTSMMQVGNLALMICLLVLCTQDPIFHCMGKEGPLFTQQCSGYNIEVYSTLSMVAMLLYWALLLDLTIFSMQISAFTLVCGRVLSELGLFIGSLIFLIITFASSISALNHNCSDFTNIPAAYGAVYDDMVGYARLTRGSIIVSALGGISSRRWQRYLETLGFEETPSGVVGMAESLASGASQQSDNDSQRRWRLHVAMAAASPALLALARRSSATGTSQADFLKVLRRKRASLEEAESAAEGLRAGGYLSGVRSYSSAIVASSRGRKWQVAMQLFDEMLEIGLRPTASAFSAAREACEEGGHAALALRVREVQGDEAPVPKAKKLEVVPMQTATQVLYSKGALCTRFREKDAPQTRLSETAELLRSGGHLEETLSYTTALRNCEHGHHWPWALSLLGEMRDRSAIVEQDVVTYNVAIAACGRAQQWERSLVLLESMPSIDISPDFETYQAASLACSRNGEWEQALAFLAVAQALQVANAESWHIGMMACASAGAWEATLEMLECAGSESSPREVSRDLMCYGVALYACMEAGRWPLCLALLERMRSEEVEADAVALACAAQACRDGRTLLAVTQP
eukprot:g3514.t1